MRRLPVQLTRRSLSASISLLIAGGGASFFQDAPAGPAGGRVVGGSGSISTPNDKTTQVRQQSAQLLIDWDSFNLGSDELVQFNQPSASAQVLNRIFDQSASQIFGRINANGHVYLMNPNGVIFGRTAQVDVNSLVAASANINAEDFMSGRFRLISGDGFVINRGTLKAARGGFITLAGKSVGNEGLIVADYGRVNLVSGDIMTLDFDGDGLIRFAIDKEVLENPTETENAVSNTGTIQAEGGQVMLAGAVSKDIFSRVVNNEGMIKAGRIDTSGGQIRLIATGGDTHNSGTLDASARASAEATDKTTADTDGGTIHVLGDNVALSGDAIVAASGSGKGDGGEILIGGDYQGANPDIKNAASTWVGPNVTVNANAGATGKGGKVIIWSDQATRAHGKVTAKGGTQSGDGGLIETSGGYLDVSGIKIDAGAGNGRAGQWLLDPEDITIVDGSDNNVTAGPVFDTTGTNANISNASIETALSAGTDVTVQTGATVNATTAGNITVAANITATNATDHTPTLTLMANGSIIMNENVTISATGNLALAVDFISDQDGSDGGNIRMLSGSSIVTNGGDITFRGVGLVTGTAKERSGISLNNATLNASAGDINITGNATNGTGTFIGDDATVSTTDGNLTITGNATNGTGTLIVDDATVSTTGGNLTITGDALSGIGLGIYSDGTVSTTDGNLTINGSSMSNRGVVMFGDSTTVSTTDGNLTITGNATNGSGTFIGGDATVSTAGTGDLTITGNSSMNRSGVQIEFRANVSTTGTGDLTITGNSTNGAGVQIEFLANVSTTGTGDLTITGNSTNGVGVSISTEGRVSAPNGIITLNGTGGMSNPSIVLRGNRTFTRRGLVARGISIGPILNARDIRLIDNSTTAAVGLDLSRLNRPITATGNLTVISIGADNGILGGSNAILTVGGTTDINISGNATGLTNASNNLNFLNVTAARDFTLHDSDGLTIGTSTITGNLTINANGSIADNGVINVSGASRVAVFNANLSGANGDVSLDTIGNDFNIINVTAANVTIRDSNAVSLGQSNVTGDLNVTAGGAVTDSGTLNVTGTASVDAGTNAITLDGTTTHLGDPQEIMAGDIIAGLDQSEINARMGTGSLNGVEGEFSCNRGGGRSCPAFAGSFPTGTDWRFRPLQDTNVLANDFGTVELTGSDVTVVDSDDIDLGASTATNLDVTAGGAVTDSGTLNVTGTASVDAGTNAITLDEMTNDFGTVELIGSDVTVVDSDDIDLGASTVTGDLAVMAGGDVTDSGVVMVTGMAQFTVPDAGNITLDSVISNYAGNVTFSSGGTLNDVAIVDNSDFGIQDGLNVTGNLNITVRSADLTQYGEIIIGGTLNAAGRDITLDNASNDFTTVQLMGRDVTVVDSDAVELGASTVSRNLNVTAGGAVTDSGPLNVTGTASVDAGTNAITLDETTNDFGTVELTGSDVTVVDSDDIDLGASTATNLDVTAGGAVTNSGALSVTGTASVDAGTNAITLDETSNDFNTVELTGSDVTVVDSDDIDLGASTATNLDVTAGGAVTDSGTLNVTGTASVDAGTNAITLDETSNDFNTVELTGSDVVVRDRNGIDLGASTVSGDLSVTSRGAVTDSGTLNVTGTASINARNGMRAITLDEANNDFTTVELMGRDVTMMDRNGIDLGTSTVSGNLSVTAGGAVTDSGTLNVTGTASVDADTNAITLDETTNDFGMVELTGSDVTVVDSDDIDLGASTAATLTVTAGGAVTDSGPLNVTGTASVDAGTNAITLDETTNDFGTVELTGSDVTVVDSDDIDLGASTATNLDVTAGGAVTDSGPLNVTGTASVDAGTNAITLDETTNDFGTVALTGSDVTVVDSDGIDLGASTATNLDVTAGGAVTDSGPLNVTGTASINANSGMSAITLDEMTNDFNTVELTGSDVTVVDSDDIDLGASAAATLTVTAGGAVTNSGALNVTGTASVDAGTNAITLDETTNDFGTVELTGSDVTVVDSDDIDLGASAATNLDVTAGGAVTDSGTLNVTGTASVDAGTNAITLDETTNDFGTVELTGSDVTVVDSDDIDLGASAATNLDVTAGGAVTDSGPLNVTGTASVDADTNAITLDETTNDFGTVELTGSDVTVVDSDDIDLGASTVTGDLEVMAGGDVTDSGVVMVTGMAQFTVPDAGNITLDSVTSNYAGNVTFSSGGTLNDVAIVDNSDFGIQDGLNVTGNLNITARSADLTQYGEIIIGGTLNAAGRDITLDNASNDFTTVQLMGRDVTVVDSDAVDLGASTVSRNLNVTAGGAVTDSGPLNVTGTASVDAGTNAITLDETSNDFNTVELTGSDVTVVDSDDIDLGASTATNLDVTAGGAVTNSGALNVTGTASVDAGTNAITLDETTNDFGTVELTGSDVTVMDSDDIDLGTSTATNLNVTAGGAVTDSGTLNVTGTASVDADTNAITLDETTNDFGTVELTGSDVTVVDSDDIDLGASTATNLDVTAGGAVTDSGPLNVTGTASMDAGTNAITLDETTNDFGTVELTGSDVTVVDSDDIDLGASTATNLDVTAGGAVTDSGTLNVTGTASVDADTNAITLDETTNDFGTVELTGSDVTVVDSDDIDLGASAATNLDVTAGGAVTDSGALNVTGTASVDAGTNAITLDETTNDFGTVALTGSDVTVVDSDDIDLGASTATNLDVTAGGAVTDSGPLNVTGTASVDAGTNAITLDETTNDFGTVELTGSDVTVVDSDDIDLGASTVTGDLGVMVGGDVTDSGVVMVTGMAQFTVPDAGNITLDSVTSNYAGNVTFSSGGTLNNVAIVDNSDFGIQDGLNVTGNLNITARSADLTQYGEIIIGGTLNASGRDITLDNASNDFTTVQLMGRDVTVVDSDAVDLGASTVSRNLNVTAGGAVTDSGPLNVTGTASVDAGTNAITLDETTNDFGTVELTGSDVTVVDRDDIDLGASTATNLDVTAGGAVTDSGTLNVTGTASVDADTNAITLDETTNDFGTVELTGSDVTVVDSDDIDLGASTATNLDVTAGGTVTDSGPLNVTGTASVDADTNAITLDETTNDFGTVELTGSDVTVVDRDDIDLGASTATNLNVTAGGAVTDSGTLNITGTASVDAGTNAITLDETTNDFGTVELTGSDVTVVDSDDIDLGASAATNLDVTAGGAVTDSGTLNVTGTASVDAGTNAITLDETTNDFGTVELTGSDVTVVDSDDIDLGASTVTGDLEVMAGGDVTDSGVVMVTGMAQFTVPDAGNITLDSVTSNYAGNVTFSSGGTLNNVAIVDNSDFGIQDGLNVTGNLNITARSADLTQYGEIIIGGTLNAAGRDITLDNASNDFTTVQLMGRDVTVVDSDAVELGASTVSRNLNVTAGGAVTDSGPLNVTGTASVDAGTNAITLDETTNDFGTVELTGSDVTVVDRDDIDLGASAATNLDVTAGGAVTDSGPLNVTGTASINANSGMSAITLDETSNDFNTVELTGSDVTVVDSDDIDLGASAATTLTVTAGGAVTNSGALNVTGTASVDAGTNAITLDETTNDFGTVELTGSDVTVVDSDDIDLGASTATNLDVTAGGAVTDSGTLNVTGTASVDAGTNAITLDETTNDFGTVELTGSDVTVVDSDDIDLGASTATNLDVTAGGAVTNSGALNVTGTASVDADTNAITLDEMTNDFGTVQLTGSDVTVVDSDDIDLGASTVTGDLEVMAGGDVTDSGVVMVTGMAQFTVPDAGNITLDSVTSNYAGNVTFSSGGTLNDVAIVDNSDFGIQDGLNITGNLNITARSADLTQYGEIIIGGTLNAAGRDITLDNASNDFTTVQLMGRDVTVVDSDAVELGASTVSRNLNVTAGGAVTDSGPLNVTGTASVDAGTNAITLDETTNDFGTVELTGSDVTVVDRDDIDLGASAATNLDVTAGGAVTDSGPLNVTGTASINANSGMSAITLDETTNDFGTVELTGSDVTVMDSDDIDLGASAATTLTVTAGGAVTNSGALNVTGTASVDAGTNAITLDETTNDFGTVELTGSDVTVVDSDDIDLGASTATNLDVTAGGAVTDSGPLNVTGTASMDAGTNAITLDETTNDFGTVELTGSDVTVVDSDDIDLGASTATNLDVTAGGAVTDSGTLNVTGTASVDADTNAITLDETTNDFGTVQLTGGDVIVRDQGDIDLGASRAANLNVTAGGNVTSSSTLNVTGTAPGNLTLTTTAGHRITLASVTVSNGKHITLNTDDVDFLGGSGSIQAVGDTSNLTIVPVSDSLTIGLGSNVSCSGSCNMSINERDWNAIADGWCNIIIGSSASSIYDNPGESLIIRDPLTLLGSVILQADHTFSDSGVGKSGSLDVNGTTFLAAGNLTAESFTFGDVIVIEESNITSTGGDITFNGRLSSEQREDNALNLNAQDGGNISFYGDIGSDFSATGIDASHLGELIIRGDQTSTNVVIDSNNISAVGLDIDVANILVGNSGGTGSTTINLNNGSGAAIDFSGTPNVSLTGDVFITSSDGDVNFGNAANRLDGNFDITINTAQSISLGNVGQSVPLSNLTILGSGALNLYDSVTASEIDFSSVSEVIIHDDITVNAAGTGNTTLANLFRTDGNSLTFGGNVVLAESTEFNMDDGLLTFGIEVGDTLSIVNNLTITAAEIDFRGGANSVLSGGSNIVLRQHNADVPLYIGGDTDSTDSILEISNIDLAALGQSADGSSRGWDNLVLGRDDSVAGGRFRSAGYVFNDPVTILQQNTVTILQQGNIFERTNSGFEQRNNNAPVTEFTSEGNVTIDLRSSQLNWYVDANISGHLTINSNAMATINLGSEVLDVGSDISAESFIRLGNGRVQINQDTVLSANDIDFPANVVGADGAGLAILPGTSGIDMSINGDSDFNINSRSFSGLARLFIGGVILDTDGNFVSGDYSDYSENATVGLLQLYDTANPDINALNIVDSVDIADDVAFTNTDFVIISSGNIIINAIAAASGSVTLLSQEGSIYNQPGRDLDTISADALYLVAQGEIGTISSAIQVSVPNGITRVQFAVGEAPEVFINNLVGGVASVTESGGAIVLTEQLSSIEYNTMARALNTASLFASAQIRSDLEGVGFIDVSLFDESIELFGRVEPGVSLPETQSDDYLPPDVLDDTSTTDAIDTEAIDIEAIDIEAIDIEAIDTEAVDTEAIDTEAVDTEAIDTEAIDTEAIDTEAIDTEAVDKRADEEEYVPDEELPELDESGCPPGFRRAEEGSCVLDFGYKAAGESYLLTLNPLRPRSLTYKAIAGDNWSVELNFYKSQG